MDWLVEEMVLAALIFRLTVALLPGSMSDRRKVDTSLRSMRDSEGATVTTGATSLAEPAFWKVTVISRVSSGAMGVSMGERVTMTTGWGTLSLAWAGMVTLSVTLAWTEEILL